MKLPIFHVDAFTDRVFSGNPAAVCPLDAWLPDALLQSIATENNLADTAFFVPEGAGYRLRWFTPVAEVDLCGHATLATADVLYRQLGYAAARVEFFTRSGILTVERRGDRYALDLPATMPEACAAPAALIDGLRVTPVHTLAAFDYIAVLEAEADVRAVTPDFATLSTLDRRGVVVTAPGLRADFVSRFFAPALGLNEDPVTGSAHCELAPYWGRQLQKTELQAEQVSTRGGFVECELRGDRVILCGHAAHYLTGEITVG